MAHSAIKGKLISVIGDEVSSRTIILFFTIASYHMIMSCDFSWKDTCVGFLLGGVGEINKNRHPNFMVVDKSKYMI